MASGAVTALLLITILGVVCVALVNLGRVVWFVVRVVWWLLSRSYRASRWAVYTTCVELPRRRRLEALNRPVEAQFVVLEGPLEPQLDADRGRELVADGEACAVLEAGSHNL